MALGQACVLHVGSIDLSNAAMAVLSAMVLAMTLGSLGPRGRCVTLDRLATLIGVVNGLSIAYSQVPSFALTLGTLGILQAASLVDQRRHHGVRQGQLRRAAARCSARRFVSLPMAFWLAVLLAVGDLGPAQAHAVWARR